MATRQVLAELAAAYEQRAGIARWRSSRSAASMPPSGCRPASPSMSWCWPPMRSTSWSPPAASSPTARSTWCIPAWRSPCKRRRAAARHRLARTRCGAPCWPRRSIGYSTGPSGVALAAAVRALGHRRRDAEPRIVQAPPGVPVGTLVARGEVALGFQQLSELMHLEGIDVRRPAARRRSRSSPPFPAASAPLRRQAEAVRRMLDFHGLARGGRSEAPPRHGAGLNSYRRTRTRAMSMIIDCHGHYTTAPKALEDWRNQQIAGIKDPSVMPKARRPEDQRRRAARDRSRATSCG